MNMMTTRKATATTTMSYNANNNLSTPIHQLPPPSIRQRPAPCKSLAKTWALTAQQWLPASSQVGTGMVNKLFPGKVINS